MGRATHWLHAGYYTHEGQSSMKVARPRLRCGAKTRTGAPCRQWAMQPAGRCRKHGGATLRGMASPTWKHGRASKYGHLPPDLVQNYEATLNDPELRTMRHELALIDVRLQELVGNLGTGENDETWLALSQQWAAFRAASNGGNIKAAEAAIDRMDVMMQEGAVRAALWQTVAQLIRDRRALVESENNRLLKQHVNLTTERALALLATVVHVLRQHIADPLLFRAIATDLQRFAIQAMPIKAVAQAATPAPEGT